VANYPIVEMIRILRQSLSNDLEERTQALEQLHNSSSLPDKQQAWDDLHRLTIDGVLVNCDISSIIAGNKELS